MLTRFFYCFLPAFCIVQQLHSQVVPDHQLPVPAQTVNLLPKGYDISMNINYVRTWQPYIPILNEVNILAVTRTPAEVLHATQYFDGLGRPLQTVSKAISPSGKDMVSPVIYDAFGREAVQYLPYVQVTGSVDDGKFKLNPFADQAAFYSNTQLNPGTAGEQVCYNRTTFEASPFNRPLNTYAAGNSWGGNNRGISLKYEFNTIEDAVRIWNINVSPGAIPATAAIYNPGELYKNIITDEHGKQVEELKDKDGRIILKKVQIDNIPSTSHSGWLCTYYVYDDLGQLRCVLQPKLVKYLAEHGFPPVTVTQADELCFRYEYDAKGRMIIKKVPGAGEVHMVYDERDRLIMTQDAAMRNTGKWMVTQYDELNRPLRTYLWNNTQNRVAHAANADNTSFYPVISGAYTLLTETYYDDYSWVPPGINGISASLDNSYSSSVISSYNTAPLYAQQIVRSNLTKGQVTGTKVNVLGTNNYTYTVSFYDDKGRVVQVRATNTGGGYDIITTQYDFSGKALRVHQLHNNPGASNTTGVLTKMEYDHAGRLLTVTKKVNSQQDVVISRNEYNELGQLRSKKLGQRRDDQGQYTAYPLETLDYTYNIRGWITSINKNYVEGNNNKGNWFGMTLSYDHGFTQKQYNGNISGTRWKSRGAGIQRAYGFNYDAANRLLKADFTENNSGNWNTASGVDLSMKMGDGMSAASAYDANGNILKMWQKGLTVMGSKVIDDLGYGYFDNSNKLRSVSDPASLTATGLGDFTDKNTTSDDYDYDINGNLKYDKNKDIASVEYNHLNLPSVIAITGKGTITYTYDATGNKLRKTTIDNTTNPAKTTVTDYIGGFVYEKVNTEPPHLLFLGHEEGRVRPAPAQAGGWAYDYFIKDHLGNVRTVLTDEGRRLLYIATLERDRIAEEEQVFSSLQDVEKPTLFDAEAGNEKVDKVNATASQTVIGAGLLLKVMAGDKINAAVFARYNKNQQSTAPGDNKAIAQQIAEAMNSSFAKQFSMHGASAKYITSSWMSGILSFLSSKPGEQKNPDNTLAHINWILLDDEQLKYVPESSGYQKVPQIEATDEKQLVQAEEGEDIEISRNGYIYIYVSNSSKIPMFFDDLKVAHTPGPLVEETYYYPFGLTMKGISSKAMNSITENKIKFQTQEFTEDLGLSVYEFKYRMHDPLIGRFFQVDPLANDYVYNSTYAFSENKVTAHIELEGLEAVSAGKPEGYLMEGFRQIGQAAGRLIDKINIFKYEGEVHLNFNKNVEVKAGSGSSNTTVSVSENTASFKVGSFEDLFKYNKSPIEFKTESNTLSKIEVKNAINATVNGVQLEASQKTTIDGNGTKNTISAGAKISTDVGNIKVDGGAEVFYSNQISGTNAGQQAVGVKVAADATFVSKKTLIINNPAVQVSTSSQTKVGVSLEWKYKWPL